MIGHIWRYSAILLVTAMSLLASTSRLAAQDSCFYCLDSGGLDEPYCEEVVGGLDDVQGYDACEPADGGCWVQGLCSVGETNASITVDGSIHLAAGSARSEENEFGNEHSQPIAGKLSSAHTSGDLDLLQQRRDCDEAIVLRRYSAAAGAALRQRSHLIEL